MQESWGIPTPSGCGAAALVARLAKLLTELQATGGATPDAVAMKQLHRRLAQEMGLAVGSSGSGWRRRGDNLSGPPQLFGDD